MSVIHAFSFGKVLLQITSIFNALELINNIKILEKLQSKCHCIAYNIRYIKYSNHGYMVISTNLVYETLNLFSSSTHYFFLSSLS